MLAEPAFSSTTGEPLLAWDDVLELLSGARVAWLATTRASGAPHTAPVWLVVHDAVPWLWTPASSTKGRNLARDGRVALHAESGDRVAIVDALATNAPAPPDVRDRYARKYGATGLELDAWWSFRPIAAVAWDGHTGSVQRRATRFAPQILTEPPS
jgi:hypothetical protein